MIFRQQALSIHMGKKRYRYYTKGLVIQSVRPLINTLFSTKNPYYTPTKDDTVFKPKIQSV